MNNYRKNVDVDNRLYCMSERADELNAEFDRLLGMTLEQGGWTEFVISVLLGKGVQITGAFFEDFVNDIINGILMDLYNPESGISKSVAESQGIAAGNLNILINRLKPIMTTAVMYRFRDFRRPSERTGHSRYDVIHDAVPELTVFQVKTDDIAGEIDVQRIIALIKQELMDIADKKPTAPHQIACQIFPDRIEGLGIREICEKHHLMKGGSTTKALATIEQATRNVVNRIKQPAMMDFIACLGK